MGKKNFKCQNGMDIVGLIIFFLYCSTKQAYNENVYTWRDFFFFHLVKLAFVYVTVIKIFLN
jgi:hypothetical protein